MLNVDRLRLRSDIQAVSKQLRELKAITRESGQPRMTWRTRADIEAAKARATLLCSLMAHCRGRLHRPATLDMAAQAAYVAAVLDHYAPEAQRPSTESNDLGGCGFEPRQVRQEAAA